MISKYYHELHEYFIIFNILFMNSMNNLYIYLYLLCESQKTLPDHGAPKTPGLVYYARPKHHHLSDIITTVE